MPVQTLQYSFAGGLDEKTAAEYVDPTSRLLDAVNCVFTHDGSLEKRLGLQTLSSKQRTGDPTMSSPKRLVTRGGEITSIDGDSLFSYASGIQLWSKMSNVSPCVASRTELFSAPGQSLPSDTSASELTGFSIAESNGVRLVAYRTSNSQPGRTAGDVFVQAFDVATGANIGQAMQQTDSADTGVSNSLPVILAIGMFAYLFWTDSSAKLHGQVLNLPTMTWYSPVTLASDVSVSLPTMDAVAYSDGSGILLAYQQHGVPNHPIRFLRFEALPSLTVSASFTVATDDLTHVAYSLSVAHDATIGQAWATWTLKLGPINTYAVYVVSIDLPSWTPGTPGPVAAAATDEYGYVGILPLAINSALISTKNSIFLVPGDTRPFVLSSSSYSESTAGSLAGSISRPFKMTCGDTSRVFIVVEMWQELQYNAAPISSSYYVVEITPSMASFGLRTIAVISPRQSNLGFGYNIPSNDAKPINVVVTGSTVRTIIAVNANEEFNLTPQVGQAVTSALAPAVNVQLLDIDFSGETSWQHCEGSGETFISGGMTSLYDGDSVQELGFLQWPSGIQLSTSTLGGHLGSGTYGYALCWAWLDGSGLIHRSAVWTGSITTGEGTTNLVELIIPELIYTQHRIAGRTPVLEVYRTLVNGTTYYFDSFVVATPGTPFTLLDTAPDNTSGSTLGISTNTVLYTTGGILDSVCPPSSQCIIRHKDRLWLIDDSGLVIWYSTTFNTAEAPYFNEGLTLQFTKDQLVALSELDDNLVVFSNTGIWLIAGDGPSNTGQGSDLTTATPVPTPVGCSDWRSVIAIPGGVVFQAPSSGIWLLGRDTSVAFIGKDVQDITLGQQVVSSCNVPGANHVRFVLSNGVVLTYDYVLARWARFDYPAPLTPSVSAMSGQSWCSGSSSGLMSQEKAIGSLKAYYDSVGSGNQWVTSSITLAHVKPGGLQGWATTGAVSVYAKWLDAADLSTSLTFDYGAAVQGPVTFTHSSLYAANRQAAQWQLWPQASNSMAEAIQVTLSDAPPSDNTDITGQGVRWLGVAFDFIPTGMRKQDLGARVRG